MVVKGWVVGGVEYPWEDQPESVEFEFEWRFYPLSASKAIFRARTYSRIT